MKRIRQELIKRDGERCTNKPCGRTTDLTVDHIIPLSHGGGNELRNLRFLCWPCHEFLNKYEELPPEQLPERKKPKDEDEMTETDTPWSEWTDYDFWDYHEGTLDD